MVEESLISDLIDLFGNENVFSGSEQLAKISPEFFYGDYNPIAIVRPSEIRQLNRLLILMKRYKISGITPRGWGNTFGAYSNHLIIDLYHFNKILEIDEDRYIVTLQSGIRFNDLETELSKKKLKLPVSPIENGTLGGFISTLGIQTGQYRFGSIENYLRSVSLFTSKKMIKLGTKNTPPFTSGYNFTSLLGGSMGYYGIIIDMTLELFPLPEKRYDIRISCKNVHDVVNIVNFLKHFESLTNLTIRKSGEDIQILIILEGFSELVELENEKLHSLKNVEIKGIDHRHLLDTLHSKLENEIYSIPALTLDKELMHILKQCNDVNFIIHYTSKNTFMFSPTIPQEEREVKINLFNCSKDAYFSKENQSLINKLKEIIDPFNYFQPGMID
ncbi:MAG: FAD-binding oxidoreductase [Candidatus Helarchaeota archaeon]